MTKYNLSVRKEPVQLRSKDTVQTILKAAAHILAESSGQKFTTNFLAKVAGVSVGSIYQYFPNKNAIISALVTDYVSSQGQIVINELLKLEDGPSIEECLKSVIVKLYHYRASEMKLNRAVASQLSGGQLIKELDEVKINLSEMITDVLFNLKYSASHRNLKIKVTMVVELCDQLIDHLLLQHYKEEELEFALGHLNQLILHSLDIDRA
ncbi:MAG: TetR/AcrR family transcriptional regulator [Bacteriovoracaceae bacterium]|jgi:AcrR family transcriptional regulator|nr:TetR/AcrR family transcriptional regulator [Bacteriovoracaceae bacterium]